MDYGLDEELRPAAGTAADAEEFAIARKHRSGAKGSQGIRELCQSVGLWPRDIIKRGLKWSFLRGQARADRSCSGSRKSYGRKVGATPDMDGVYSHGAATAEVYSNMMRYHR